MIAAEIKRRSVFFVVFAGTLLLVLILFPFLEEFIRNAVISRFGLIVATDGSIATIGGEAPSTMIQTSISLIVNVLHIIKIILWMMLVVAVVRYLGFLVTTTVYRNSKQGEVSSLLKTILSIIVYIVSFFIVFQSQFPEVQLAPLFTGSTILGIVVGLALQDTLGNLFAGLALSADQPFGVGDVILLPGRGEGVVESVSWRGVQIRTFSNKLLVVSNSVLGKELIEVAPKDNLNAKLVFFNTLYTNSPAKTINAVRKAVRQVQNVSPKMRPVVRIRNLAADGIDWEVKYWLEDYRKQHDTDALIRERIWYVFQRENIDFAYPTRTVYMEKKAEAAPAEETFNYIAERLNQVSIFAPLDETEIHKLANASASRVYARNESIVRIGEEGKSMYVVLRGSVKIEIPNGNGERAVGTLKENDFFGEMSLLTGDPRTATVTALEESEVLRIDKHGIKPIFEKNPKLAESVGELVVERRKLLANIEEEVSEENANEEKKRFRGKIRKFFGIR